MLLLAVSPVRGPVDRPAARAKKFGQQSWAVGSLSTRCGTGTPHNGMWAVAHAHQDEPSLVHARALELVLKAT